MEISTYVFIFNGSSDLGKSGIFRDSISGTLLLRFISSYPLEYSRGTPSCYHDDY
jgi:hypothetical protein